MGAYAYVGGKVGGVCSVFYKQRKGFFVYGVEVGFEGKAAAVEVAVCGEFDECVVDFLAGASGECREVVDGYEIELMNELDYFDVLLADCAVLR